MPPSSAKSLYLILLGFASLCFATPIFPEAETYAAALDAKSTVYRTDTYVDEHGVEKRSTQAVSRELLNKFIYYSEMCAAAYCGPQLGKTGGKVTCESYKTCNMVEKSNTKVLSTWYAIGNNSATGFVALDHTNKNIVLSMRGSVGLSNWIADIKFNQMECSKYAVKGSLCSTGFLGFWEQSKPPAMKGIEAGLKSNPDYSIVVTGHSLGGAAAVYAASELRKQHKNVTLYTYGQPRAGNEILSKHVTDQGQNFRVTHTSDAVPKLPPESGLTGGVTGYYRHISPEYWISDGLGNKPENIKMVTGLTSNDGNAGTGQMKFNIVAHIQYFQVNMYYCALPIPMFVGYGEGTKARREIAGYPNLEDRYDEEGLPEESIRIMEDAGIL